MCRDTKPWLGPAPVGGNLTWSMITTNVASTCGIITGSRAYCWGANDHGQLGDGTTTPHLLPTPVAGPM